MSKGFGNGVFDGERLEKTREIARLCRGDILTMTTLAGSGHPGGSMSSIDILATLYEFANINPENVDDESRDRIIVSNGHISPAVYSILGRNGFFDIDECIASFRKAGTRFEGHVDIKVPGVEWITGNLGQGLSTAAGIALGLKKKGKDTHIFVLMGDGEQQKGQISEARRFASKFELNNLTVIVDYNQLQISGSFHDVMDMDLESEYKAAGWDVYKIDGHDHMAVYEVMKKRMESGAPAVIIAETVMGKGVSFMEDDAKWHGQPIKEEALNDALKELSCVNRLDKYKKMRAGIDSLFRPSDETKEWQYAKAVPEYYPADTVTDNRSAFGSALLSIADANKDQVAVFDCDLSGSVKTDKFAEKYPHMFFQSGIQEHNTASAAGGMSKTGFLTYWADFGVFASDEVFNQLRLNEINKTDLKIAATHCGLNVGEDGKTHHAINYVGLMNALYDFKLLTPGDPNQTLHATVYSSSEKGNVFMAMGRAKVPVITDEDGRPYFGRDYIFEYGKMDLIREGDDAVIFAMGAMLPYAMKVREIMKKEGRGLAVVNVSAPLAVDKKQLAGMIAGKKLIAVYEDHNVKNGLGSIISNIMADEGLNGPRVMKFGVTGYARSGKADDVYRLAGLDAETVAGTLLEKLKKNG